VPRIITAAARVARARKAIGEGAEDGLAAAINDFLAGLEAEREERPAVGWDEGAIEGEVRVVEEGRGFENREARLDTTSRTESGRIAGRSELAAIDGRDTSGGRD
jgi:hypothetical protein